MPATTAASTGQRMMSQAHRRTTRQYRISSTATSCYPTLRVLYQSTATPNWYTASRGLPLPPIVADVAGGARAQRVRVDLHLHSSASFDSRVAPLEVARRCRQV